MKQENSNFFIQLFYISKRAFSLKVIKPQSYCFIFLCFKPGDMPIIRVRPNNVDLRLAKVMNNNGEALIFIRHIIVLLKKP